MQVYVRGNIRAKTFAMSVLVSINCQPTGINTSRFKPCNITNNIFFTSKHLLLLRNHRKLYCFFDDVIDPVLLPPTKVYRKYADCFTS